MRGRYRQYFLRVTADGSIDCQPANLRVTRERTLDVFVEFVSVMAVFECSVANLITSSFVN